MARYRLKMMLDAGAGVCLWAANDAARERFGYSVETAALGLPPDVAAEVEQLIADHDAAIDWNDPGGAAVGDGPGAEQRGAVVARLRAALGPEFAVEGDS